MSQILPDGISDDVSLSLIPTHAGFESMNFQTHESPNRKRDMSHLSVRRADLCFFDTTTLLNTSMVAFDRPGLLLQLFKLLHRHVQLIGRPVLRVSVWRNHPKHLDEPVAFEMYLSSIRPDLNSADSNVTTSIRVDLSVGLEPAQPRPSIGANQLDVVQRTVPAIEENGSGSI